MAVLSDLSIEVPRCHNSLEISLLSLDRNVPFLELMVVIGMRTEPNIDQTESFAAQLPNGLR